LIYRGIIAATPVPVVASVTARRVQGLNYAQLRPPHKLAVDSNQAAGLQLRSNASELLAWIFGVRFEYAAHIKLLAPSAQGHNDGSGWQFEMRRGWLT
jgi:hypothetical protein